MRGALVAILACVACGGSDEPEPSGRPEAPQPIGYSCGSDEHCESGACAAEDSFRFCSASCAAGEACPAGSVCEEGLCLAPCTSDADCAGTFDDTASFYTGKETGGGKCIVSQGICWPAADQ